MLVGVQFLPVMSDQLVPAIRKGLLRSRVIVMIANATAELTPSATMSTCLLSIHSRTMPPAMSGLFWWIGRNDLDLAAADHTADLFGRHLRCDHRALAVAVLILAAHVGDDADLQRVLLRPGGCAEKHAKSGAHNWVSPFLFLTLHP